MTSPREPQTSSLTDRLDEQNAHDRHLAESDPRNNPSEGGRK
ncbi:hypothetical protein [Thermostaphylospora chromogena]|uniref:Uncharacterized protein n=1 Tax=Thermostaphylospora chromogena TaxID=35622 RepID=A0A1H0XJX7_9ACTN|nr:hypothetical protein [Thermostaphylospora chromogena]SDQ03220.1 hypothetical protein SAMN04489764_0026 [Thermostaphylospora chromogena]SDQ03380.1 hypothetical protein SAMN04489764_0052 [Thermostaphylospora chromogena]